MAESMAVQDFSTKFVQLTEQNQKYVLAIQQALLYAQDAEKGEKTEESKKMEDEQ